VIHFNWGLHDVRHVDAAGLGSPLASDPPATPIDTYRRQLRRLVKRLKATGAKLIFATTTPVPDVPLDPYRSNVDVIRYNDVALAIRRRYGVAVDDLYEFALPQLAALQIPDDVHFRFAGSRALAAEVARAIQAEE